jgi:hypothetical protein
MNRKRILYAVLDWGLGHATRSYPLIRHLMDQDIEVVLAGNGPSLHWLRKRLPGLAYHEKPGKAIRYSKSFNTLKIASQGPSFLASAQDEKAWTQALLNKEHFDGIISDNCYGVCSKDVPSVLITHQLNLPVPSVFTAAGKKIIRRLTAVFQEVWVPDLEGRVNLAGQLSHPDITGKARYIGILSQSTSFSDTETPPLVGMVSGPEPHRTVMEEALIRLFRADKRQAYIFAGRPKEEDRTLDNVEVRYDASSAFLMHALKRADVIVCRSGYSSLMDLAALKKSAILVPTPGQPEQEFLADHWQEAFDYTILEQRKLEQLEELPDVTGDPPNVEANVTAIAAIEQWLGRL